MSHLSSSTSLTPAHVDPLKSDFRLFLYLAWDHLGLPTPTPVQLDIAHYLQHGPKRMVIMAWRGAAKSWITSAFILWLLYCDPQCNNLVVSASKARADDFSTFTLRLIEEMPILAHLKSREGQRSSKIAFDVGPAKAAHAPSVKSAGITGQITGSRANTIVGDDIEVPNNSATQTMREKLAQTVKEFDSILKPQPDARIIFLGTPQSDQSIYNELLSRGFEIRIWPARYPGPKLAMQYGDKLAPMLRAKLAKDPTLGTRYGGRGEPVDPTRFTHADLLEREASIGRSTFALQFMLDTTLSDTERYPLKLRDLIFMDCDPEKAPVDLAYGSSPELALTDVPNVGFNGDRMFRPFMIGKDWSPYQSIIMAIDPAGRGTDEVGYAVLSFHYGRLYLLDAGGLKGGYEDDNLIKLAEIAKRWKVNKIIDEPNFGDGMFGKLLRPVLARIYPCTMEETERSSTQKEARIIDTLEPVANQHRLIVNKALIQQDFDSTSGYPVEQQQRYRLFYQLTRITRDRGALAKDDRLDAVALCVHYYKEKMDRDVQKAEADHKAKLLDVELRRFAKSVLGKAPRGPRFAGRR